MPRTSKVVGWLLAASMVSCTVGAALLTHHPLAARPFIVVGLVLAMSMFGV